MMAGSPFDFGTLMDGGEDVSSSEDEQGPPTAMPKGVLAITPRPAPTRPGGSSPPMPMSSTTASSRSGSPVSDTSLSAAAARPFLEQKKRPLSETLARVSQDLTLAKRRRTDDIEVSPATSQPAPSRPEVGAATDPRHHEEISKYVSTSCTCGMCGRSPREPRAKQSSLADCFLFNMSVRL